MKIKPQKIDELLSRIDLIVEETGSFEEKYQQAIDAVHPSYRESALNLIHYLALRHHDIRDMQKNLGFLGLSRLAKTEAHVMASLNFTRLILNRLKGNMDEIQGRQAISIKKSTKLLRANTKALFGNKPKGRRTRIMVTLPAEAASDYNLVYHLIRSGMNVARINCAHDSPDVWSQIIYHINKAEIATGRSCKIVMDIAGPKLRTGRLKPGPKVVRISPSKDELGRVIAPALVWLGTPKSVPTKSVDATIPVSLDWLNKLTIGSRIMFRDSRGKAGAFQVIQQHGGNAIAHCSESVYITTGTELTIEQDTHVAERVDELMPVEQSLLLKAGDLLVLHKDPVPGEQAVKDEHGRVVKPAHISCTLPEVFGCVKPGEPILFDDGKIEGFIRDCSGQEIIVEITTAKPAGSKLRADRGINLPESNLLLSGMTEKDKKDLVFIAQHAHAVNLSFVNDPADLQQVLDEILKLDPQLGVIIKIETRRGYKNLPELILTAMKAYPVGVMIARGDLAIECGWKRMARIQQEILRICEAAHVPDIWATQVLENLAKKGLPSRAEITDAAISQQAECVMLNKGAHIIQAINMLDTIIRDTEGYQDKKAPLLPELNTSIN